MSWRESHSRPSRHHARVIRRHLHLRHVDELNVENQVGLGRNSRMRRIRPRASARTVSELPGNKQPAFASDFHSSKSLVEPRNHAAESLRKSDRLHVSQLRLAIVSQHGLSVFVFQRESVIV
jgi:hypothetical protein